MKDFLETTDNIVNLGLSIHFFQDMTPHIKHSLLNIPHMRETAQEKRRVFSHIFQNNMIPWLSLVLNWIIKMDNFCRANFLQEPKETMNKLHDENWRRSQGGRKCLQCFIALRLRLVSISSVLAGFKEKNGWYREREAYISHYIMDAVWWHARYRFLNTWLYIIVWNHVPKCLSFSAFNFRLGKY